VQVVKVEPGVETCERLSLTQLLEYLPTRVGIHQPSHFFPKFEMRFISESLGVKCAFALE
jgi:hypothetical protein